MSRQNIETADRCEPDCCGPLRFMIRSGRWIMCKYPHMHPFVLSESAWRKLPLWSDVKAGRAQPKGDA